MNAPPAAQVLLLAASLLLPNGIPCMAADPVYPLEGRSVAALETDLAQGTITSERLVGLYIGRIHTIDRAGPALHAVLAIEPDALDQARASDAYRRHNPARPLEGIPVLIKDNIEAAGALPTTAGSLALARNVTGRDAPLVARLRQAGAIILGKSNLSEWANMRGDRSISGWSGLGGLTRNAYALDRSACGSSSGSGVAVSASLAPLAIGTETDGSITCPASVSGLVGLKPTVGLVSRHLIIPISASQDTAGPMARTVSDAARLLTAIAGSDPADPATRDADSHRVDYAAALNAGSLSGRRFGVLRFLAGYHPALDRVFDQALDRLRHAGATVIEIPAFEGMDAIGSAEQLVLLTELKAGLDAYLAASPVRDQPQTLSALIAFNQAHASRELALFGQELFVKAQDTPGLSSPAYLAALSDSRRRAGQDGIDRLLAEHQLDGLVAPTGQPAWLIDTVDGDNVLGGASTLPAVAGTPHLTVPMGLVDGLPVGLSFLGPAWSEARLLSWGYAFEQRRDPLPFPACLPSVTRPVAGVLEPAPPQSPDPF
jgi:amidase